MNGLTKWLLGAFLLLPSVLFAQEWQRAEDIFILSSHTASSEWAQQMLFPIEQLQEESPELRVEVEHLQLLAHIDVKTLQEAVDSILRMRTLRPRLVILLGGSAFNFVEDVEKHWPGIPMMLVGEQDYYCDIDYTLNGPGDPGARRIFVSSLRPRGFNMTLISAPPMIRHTIELILTVQPHLKRLYFVAGENYMSKERQWRVEEYIQQQHPDLDFRIISSTNTSTDRLLAILQRESGPDMAVYFSSWLIREGYLENVSTRHNTVSLIESLAPVYTMYWSDMDKHPNQVGYYSYSVDEYNETLKQYILDILDRGIRPSSLPFMYLHTGSATLNYHAMKHFGLDTRLIPEDAIVVNRPVNIWKTYRRQILWSGAAFFVLLMGFIILTLVRSMHRMQKARDLAEKANMMKTAFIQNMSHEIRTPLNSIIGFSQLLGMPDGTLAPEEKEEYLGYVLNNSHLLTVMIGDMLSLSDMENGRYTVEMAPTNLNEMTLQAIKAVESRVPGGVRIVLLPGIDEDSRYITDGIRVQQILINFLTNACKNTKEGDIVLTSSLVEHPGFITFSVADHGPGIPAEKAESIFGRFVKLDVNKQGAGLGLSICRMMAESLGGKVWLDTSYTEGARFVLTIPREEA